MTERPMGRRKSSGSMGLLWMLLAFVTVGGFMVWLGMNSQPEAVPVVDEGLSAGSEEAEFVPGQRVALDDIAAKPESYLDRELTLADVPVSSRLGETAFWAVASNGTPFLVKLSDALVSGGISVSDGQVVTVVGQVRGMSAAVLDEWQRSGVLRTESDRMVAEFATAYLEATELAAGRRAPAK